MMRAHNLLLCVGVLCWCLASVVGKEFNITTQKNCGDPRQPLNTTLPPDTNACIFRGVTVTPKEPHDYSFTVPSVPQYDIIFTLASLAEGKASMALLDADGEEVQADSDPRGQSYLFLTRDSLVLGGNYTLRVLVTNALKADYTLRVFTPTTFAMLQTGHLTALKALVKRCCATDTISDTCNMLRAAVKDKRAPKDDICHQPPNMCDAEGNLIRLQLFERDYPALNCKDDEFPYDIISEFTSLRQLVVTNNNLLATSKNLSTMIAVMPNMTLFRGTSNRFSGLLDCGLIKVPMTTLTLPLNNFTGPLPQCFFNSFYLKSLSLWGNGLSGPLPDPGSNSPLEVLLLTKQYGVGFTGSIPKKFRWLGSLQIFHAMYNNLEGMLPELPSALKDLRLSDNKLTGPIPSTILNMDSLEILDLSNNVLTGVIPPGLMGSRSIQYIDLSSNKLTGRIVPDFRTNGTISSTLGFLNLQRNRLEGPVPAGLATAQGLIQVNLAENNLTGNLDNFVQNLPRDSSTVTTSNLTFLNLNDNQLTGSVPTGLLYLKTFDPLAPTFLTSTGGIVFRYLGLARNEEMSGTFPTWVFTALQREYQFLQPRVELPNSLVCPTVVQLAQASVEVEELFDYNCTDVRTDKVVGIREAAIASSAESSTSSIKATSNEPSPSPSTATAPATQATAAIVPQERKKKDDTLPVGAIIGIVLAVMAAISVMLVVFYFFVYKTWKRTKHVPLEPTNATMPMHNMPMQMMLPTSRSGVVEESTV